MHTSRVPPTVEEYSDSLLILSKQVSNSPPASIGAMFVLALDIASGRTIVGNHKSFCSGHIHTCLYFTCNRQSRFGHSLHQRVLSFLANRYHTRLAFPGMALFSTLIVQTKIPHSPREATCQNFRTTRPVTSPFFSSSNTLENHMYCEHTQSLSLYDMVRAYLSISSSLRIV